MMPHWTNILNYPHMSWQNILKTIYIKRYLCSIDLACTIFLIHKCLKLFPMNLIKVIKSNNSKFIKIISASSSESGSLSSGYWWKEICSVEQSCGAANISNWFQGEPGDIYNKSKHGLRMKSDLSLRADIMFLFLNDEHKTSNYYNYKYSGSMKWVCKLCRGHQQI